MLFAQITDCHVVEQGGCMADRFDSAASLARTVAELNALPVRPDLVVATGDLVNDARPQQYDRFQEIVADLRAPLLPLPGNHDDRTELRRRFAGLLPPGGPDDPIDHVVDVGPVRLVLLDTQIPGSVGGRLTAGQLDWLDGVLAEAPERPTVVFQHHPPFVTGIDFMDHDGFDGAAAYESVIGRHPQVELVSCGHLHRTIHHRFGGAVAATWPSTCAQLDLTLGASAVAYTDEPPSFALHVWSPGVGFRSHLRPVGDFTRWVPTWAQRMNLS